jgi:hypothetical protein
MHRWDSGSTFKKECLMFMSLKAYGENPLPPSSLLFDTQYSYINGKYNNSDYTW